MAIQNEYFTGPEKSKLTFAATGEKSGIKVVVLIN